MVKKHNVKKTGSNRNSSNNYYQTVDLPEIINMDVLSCVNDDDLDRRVAYLASERDKAYHAGVETHPWEVEMAYVQREMKIRMARREAHSRYVRENPEFNYFDDNFSNQRDVSMMN